MSENENIYTEIIDFEDSNLISVKLAAINNKVRLSILEILRDFQKLNMNKDNSFKKDPYYSREINDILLKKYDINITPQMLGQHIKQLLDADLVEEIPLKKEVLNKIGARNVKGYILKGDAFEDLFLEINFLSDELFSFFDLYKVNQKFYDEDYCILTIFNGVDKGKTFKVHEDETVLIGRKADFSQAYCHGYRRKGRQSLCRWPPRPQRCHCLPDGRPGCYGAGRGADCRRWHGHSEKGSG